ncbi:MbcA/ParS/Xre antitoxin family protein [Ketobacter alkanivorans]|jgi:hypothetical protein|uniref:Antitoxin Xre/MbcA/ParS-like toxin-binding domain-containing protein n=1 Tax=Ketobacter alkanivorans TaxID=1917421 RepID=A0A2K9LFH9_9GAMM|nr:MbcA/ParS/Xre antitoxin family protein [Ketobacter alkanivorans]AUM11128.1 hypothetical protein Kalk_01180 [Ketobacter alkanivorans]MAR90977.1 DUF2384 domain-containing protein [Pseudomonadales bacterium]MEE2732089.1 MbcA/ParS/Xre antitoxin family protein [Pseudomonadota bacterium]HAG93521.1 DUF2384 domain-containing protein [Gammaproteobacteria bacterium]|tara:strand:+ start:841 stop:1188 length:348 start_codon:yes stop_codon:yes gene_type:complete
MKSEIDIEVAKKLFHKIASEWSLTAAEINALLGGTGDIDDRQLTEEDILKISTIAGIYGALQTLFVDESQWRGWVRKPNSDWNGLSALDVMISGKLEDIQKVRNYLSAWGEQHNL